MPRTIETAYAQNRWLKCSVTSCQKRRQGLKAYCAMHEHHVKRNGHWKAWSVRAGAFKRLQPRIAAFLQAHTDEPVVRQAERWLEGLIASGGRELMEQRLRQRRRASTTMSLTDYLKRLYVKGVSGRELLERVGAAWLLSWRDPTCLPDDQRLTFALAKQVIYTRPLRGRFMGLDKKGRRTYRAPRPQGATLRTLGEHLREHLGAFAAYMLAEIGEAEDRSGAVPASRGLVDHRPSGEPERLAAKHSAPATKPHHVPKAPPARVDDSVRRRLEAYAERLRRASR